jgi:hypothetical protein
MKLSPGRRSKPSALPMKTIFQALGPAISFNATVIAAPLRIWPRAR